MIESYQKLKGAFDSATTLDLNFAYLNGHKMLNMSTEELQKHGADLARKYEGDLNTFEFCQEFAVFKGHLFASCGDIKKASAFYLLQQIYTHDLQDAFPNIFIALRIHCTVPTTSGSCEQSFSKLKFIKNNPRSSMSQERLGSLTILPIENQIAHQINYDDAIDLGLLAEPKARRVKF